MRIGNSSRIVFFVLRRLKDRGGRGDRCGVCKLFDFDRPRDRTGEEVEEEDATSGIRRDT